MEQELSWPPQLHAVPGGLVLVPLGFELAAALRQTNLAPEKESHVGYCPV